MTATSETAPTQLAWTKQQIDQLGTMPDRLIAEDMGISSNRVYQMRASLGIAAFRPPVQWTQAALDDLGKISDRALASKHGIAAGSVSYKRRILGIAPSQEAHATANLSEATIALIGTMIDMDVAKIAGVSQTTIYQYRASNGIPAFMPRNVVPQEAIDLLGKESDSEIARRFGLSSQSVRRRRLQLQIDAFKQSSAPTAGVESAQRQPRQYNRLGRDADAFLGVLSDRSIAARFGVCHSAVRGRRQKLQIAPVTGKEG